MQSKFFIHALPRSGTAWWANLLTGDDVFCRHEALASYDVLDCFSGLGRYSVVGCSETSTVYQLSDVYKHYPDAKHIIIDHDWRLSFESLSRLGMVCNAEYLENSADILSKMQGLHIPRAFDDDVIDSVLSYLEIDIDPEVLLLRSGMRVTNKELEECLSGGQ